MFGEKKPANPADLGVLFMKNLFPFQGKQQTADCQSAEPQTGEGPVSHHGRLKDHPARAAKGLIVWEEKKRVTLMDVLK